MEGLVDVSTEMGLRFGVGNTYLKRKYIHTYKKVGKCKDIKEVESKIDLVLVKKEMC